MLKDAFVQNVSYELRSPLTNIIGFADLLATEMPARSTSASAPISAISAPRVTLGVLIDNILDLTSVDAGIAELDPEKQDVPALIDKARPGWPPAFRACGSENPLNLVVEIADGLPHFVADGKRIVQMLYNLLSNAARYSDPGQRSSLSMTSRGERMVFAIEDEGAGMPDDMKAAIFQRFEGQSVEGRPARGRARARHRQDIRQPAWWHDLDRSRQPKGTRVTVSIPAIPRKKSARRINGRRAAPPCRRRGDRGVRRADRGTSLARRSGPSGRRPRHRQDGAGPGYHPHPDGRTGAGRALAEFCIGSAL